MLLIINRIIRVYCTVRNMQDLGVIEAELMPSLVGGDAETVYGKLKSCKGFYKPNLKLVPKLRQARLYRNSKNSSGKLDEGY
jgi:hypothetical protein